MPTENCVILNGTRGTTVSAPAASSTVITPIRSALKANMLYYDTTTKEVTYGVSLSPIFNQVFNNFVFPTGDLRGSIGTVTFPNSFTSNIRVYGSFMNYFTVAGAANLTITLQGPTSVPKTIYTAYSNVATHVLTPFDVMFTSVPVGMFYFDIMLNSALGSPFCNTDTNDYFNLSYQIYQP